MSEPSLVPPPSTRSASRTSHAAGRAARWLLVLLVIVGALDGGLRVRRWAWDITAPVHFWPDIIRGYGWGIAASGPDGFLNSYDKMAAEQRLWPVFLDYAPLRLAVMTLWAAHNRHTQTPFDQWRREYDFNAPVLWFNTGFELVGVVAAFFIVRRVVLQARQPLPTLSWPAEWSARLRRRPLPPAPASLPHRPFAGWTQGLIAALLLWFNPGMILSAHAWPTWDTWIIPMYLLALLAALYDAWLLSGIALAVGVMFKGQQLIGAPVFLAWTLLQGRWTDALRWACGFFIGLAVLASPWLLTRVPAETLAAWYTAHPNGPQAFDRPPFVAQRFWNWPATLWPLGVLAVCVVLPILRRRRERWMIGVWVAAVALLVWPLAFRHDAAAAALLPVSAAILLASAWFPSGRAARAILAATATSAALLGAIAFFGASSAWWRCGVMFGTDHYHAMLAGLCDNLAGLLSRRFGWDDIDAVVFTLPPWRVGVAAVPVTIGLFLRGVFVLCMLPFLWAVARHARRRDPRLMIAVVGPWLIFYALLAQIHERYLLFSAALAVVLVAQSLGMTLLGLLLSALAFVMPFLVMLEVAGWQGRREFGALLHRWQPAVFSSESGQTLHRVFLATFPDAGWAVLLAVLIFVYQAVRSTPRSATQVHAAVANPPDFGRQNRGAAVEQKEAADADALAAAEAIS